MKQRKKKKDSRVESTYYKEITFNCPARGSVTQKVKVVKYRGVHVPLDTRSVKLSDAEQEIDDIDSGMHVFDGDEDVSE